jgi:hypothetical protein
VLELAPFEEEMFDNHSYWFQQMVRKIEKQVSRALSNYVGIGGADSSVANYFLAAEHSVKRLVSYKYKLEPSRAVSQEVGEVVPPPAEKKKSKPAKR